MAGGEGQRYAGVTVRVPDLRGGREKSRRFVSLTQIDGLRHITHSDEGTTLGSGVTIADILTDPEMVSAAPALVAAFGDIGRFSTADKAAAYLGVVPSTKQSAKTCHHGPITKQGNSNARWMLVQAAQHMARQPGP